MSESSESDEHVFVQESILAVHRRRALVVIVSQTLGVVVAPLYIYFIGFTLIDLILFLTMYWLTMGVGVWVGMHRHFSHRSFETFLPIRCVLAILGAMAGLGPLTFWVAMHRRHHERSDIEGDPHSPNLHGRGCANRLRGLWHAHMGWFWSFKCGIPDVGHYCPDITRVRALMAVSRNYRKCVLAGLIIPAAIGGIVTLSWQGALGGFLWGGLVRMFLSSHMIWAVNSVCHVFGTRPYPDKDFSRNNFILAIPSLGEAWHNNHHAYPASAAHGFHWWQVDLCYAFIWILKKTRLAWNVKQPPPTAFDR
jgi:stearoyl-CoA desaturase (delta-9 desaturase)